MNARDDSNILDRLQSSTGRVLIAGDLMLDVFHYGDITRISPEAPVPVLRVRSERRMLGGAGNVARNIAALSGHAILLAPIGRDAVGRDLNQLLEGEAALTPCLVPCDSRPTSVKRRFVAAGQQVLRADQEDVEAIDADTEARVLEAADRHLSDCGAVVLSDYGKGALTQRVVTHVIGRARALGLPVVVDPKGRDYAVYAGASCITPNLAELALATGLPTQTDAEVVGACRSLLETTGAASILATRSEKGMSLVGRDGSVIHLPAREREVFDVSGAGDTVVATLALMLASGADFLSAMRLANVAAGIVVSKQGTATCTLAELEDDLHADLYDPLVKIRSWDEARRIADQWRRLGLKVGFTNGCFDILHAGHVRMLQRSREACDRLIVGVNTDASVRRYKGPTRPVQDEASRIAVLSALASVDIVVPFQDDTPYELIRAVRPSVLLKGADYTVEQVVGADLVAADGGEVVLVDLLEGHSTTSIIKKMAQ